MGVEFNLSTFFLPTDILRFRYTFNRLWKGSKEEIDAYQQKQLNVIINHAATQVPFYIETFAKLGLQPSDIKNAQDIKKLPIITRNDIVKNPRLFQALNQKKFHPQKLNTSGTSGHRFDFLLDRQTNALEFNYYWRYWNLAGYHLGDIFVEFSTMYFLKRNSNAWSDQNLLTGRIVLNCIYLTHASAASFLGLIIEKKAKFMKGPPSVLHSFTRLLREKNHSFPQLKAIFTTSEVMSEAQRSLLESAWGCKVYDSYGHMERVVAASECPSRRMHINADYGLLQIENGKVIATTLHNMSMPLIRYDTGDIAEPDITPGPCACGSQFPTLKQIVGREEDIIITPEGRVITGLFQVFNNAPEVVWGQVLHEKPDVIRVFISIGPNYNDQSEKKLIQNIRSFVGDSMKVQIEKRAPQDSLEPGKKFKLVSVTPTQKSI